MHAVAKCFINPIQLRENGPFCFDQESWPETRMMLMYSTVAPGIRTMFHGKFSRVSNASLQSQMLP